MSSYRCSGTATSPYNFTQLAIPLIRLPWNCAFGFSYKAFEQERQGTVRSTEIVPPQPDSQREVGVPVAIFMRLELGSADRLEALIEEQPGTRKIQPELRCSGFE